MKRGRVNDMLTRLKHQEEGVRQILTSANLNAKQENRHFFHDFRINWPTKISFKKLWYVKPIHLQKSSVRKFNLWKKNSLLKGLAGGFRNYLLWRTKGGGMVWILSSLANMVFEQPLKKVLNFNGYKYLIVGSKIMSSLLTKRARS